MNSRDLASIKAIDACISQLQAIKLALISQVAVEEKINDTPSGCRHSNRNVIETMGGTKVSICFDCDEQEEIEE